MCCGRIDAWMHASSMVTNQSSDLNRLVSTSAFWMWTFWQKDSVCTNLESDTTFFVASLLTKVITSCFTTRAFPGLQHQLQPNATSNAFCSYARDCGGKSSISLISVLTTSTSSEEDSFSYQSAIELSLKGERDCSMGFQAKRESTKCRGWMRRKGNAQEYSGWNLLVIGILNKSFLF